jgi:hypothetical protein
MSETGKYSSGYLGGDVADITAPISVSRIVNKYLRL